ncbi:cytochrome P450 [Herbidospora sp. RD11066]
MAAQSALENHPDRKFAWAILLNLGAESLAAELEDRGWRVSTTEVPITDMKTSVDAIRDFLAAPDRPDQAVLIGDGTAGHAAMEVADLHPERVTAVVSVNADSEAGDLSCPALVTTDLGKVLRFLDDLDTAEPADCPVRLPALTPVLLNDPDVMSRLREMGPVHRVNIPGVATSWILTGHEATSTALADARLAGRVAITAGFRLQSDDPALTHRGEKDLITIDGGEHARLRRLVGPYLTPRRIDPLRPRIQHEIDALLDDIDPREPADLVAGFAIPLPIIVLCDLFGVPEADRGYVHEWLVERMRAEPPIAHDDIDDYFRDLIGSKKQRPADDLISWVAADGGDTSDLVSAVRFLMVGGHRAPATLLANGVAALLTHRDQWRRLVDDPALVEPATEELLRFVTPFPVGLARTVTAAIEVGDVTIPEGDLISASLVAANREPGIFPDPGLLDIGRPGSAHRSFGHGHHYCLGAALARAQTQLALGTLARRFPRMDVAPGTLDYRQSRVRYLLHLPVVLEP